MFRVIARLAYQLDSWLHRRLGRPYGVMLSIGLLADIGHRLAEAPHEVESRPRLIGVVVAVVMELALLIHQVAEMHHRLGGKAPPRTAD